MADDTTTADKRQRSKKKKSSLLTWKKKFNIKKRFSNKLPLHRRHIRSLMSGWALHEIKSVLMQYEISSMLKELQLMADKSRPSAPTLNQDLLNMYDKSSCYDMVITCCEMTESECTLIHDSNACHKEFKVHRMLVASRWPYLHDVINEEIANFGTASFHGNHFHLNPANGDIPYEARCNLNFATWNVHINGLSANKLSNILSEVYNGNVCTSQQSSPRKLLPLPTTDDSLHIRNSRRRNKQHFRYTIFECEQPPIPRTRNGVRRKHKHRFSMDERILSKQHSPPSVSPSKSNDLVLLNSGLLCQNEFRHLSFQNPYSRPQAKIAIPNQLSEDLVKMYHDTKSGLGDLKLVISTDSSTWMTQYCKKEEIIYCHRVVLAARSTYFKRLIENQVAPSKDNDCQAFVHTLEIDGNIIPSKWMSTVLYAMYTDKIHFFNLTERIVQGMAISNPLFNIEDAIMLHHIGNFIEFPILIHGCEELIVNNLDERNLLRILRWASLPHGSDWVKRQVHNFIRDRFTELLATEILFKLSVSQIVEVLRSDFVNASELDILKCALRWGEQELRRRVEENEPNLLTHTTHSISRNKTASARRREVLYSRIDELHECTAPVLACVRTQHLLPPNHEIFANAVKRGVISRLPTDLLESVTDKENGSRQWVKSRADFVPPRLFQPYMDEAKNILDERFAQESDCVNLRSMHSFPQDATWGSLRNQAEMSIPDTLYMVGKSKVPTRRRYGNRDLHLNFMQQRVESQKQKTELRKFMGDFHPVPDISVVRDLIGREREIRASHLVKRILASCADCCHRNCSGFAVVSFAGRLSIPQADINPSDDMDETEHCNRCTALRLVQLRVVREKGLPDCSIDLLQHPETYYTLSELRGVTVTDTTCMDASCKDDGQPSTVLGSHSIKDKFSFECSSTCTFEYLNQSIPHWCKVNDKAQSSIGQNSSRQSASCIIDSSSSSDIEMAVCRRRKKRNSSRKGSSSTTSHQSIPDVAASANSSLRRLRECSQELSDSALLILSTNQEILDRGVVSKEKFDGKYSVTESIQSTESSYEENVAENEFDSMPSLHRSRPAVDTTYTKSHPSRRPVSADMSELFNVALDFTDKQSDSSNENLMQLLHPMHNVYTRSEESIDGGTSALDDNGTHHCAQPTQNARHPPYYDKPDIYPISYELCEDVGVECGQYFLHSRQASSTDDCDTTVPCSIVCCRDAENDSVDDTIFL